MSAAAPRRQLSRGALIGIAAVGAAIVIAAIVLLPPPSPTSVFPTPSPTASPSASPTTSPTASPMTASPSPTPTAASGRYVNAVLGFSIQLPPPWRRTACLSVRENPQVPELLGIDVFTSVPAADESYGDTGGFEDTVSVRVVRNPSRITADAWASSPLMGSAQGQRIEPATVDGRPGVRLIGGALQTETTLVAIDDLMYMVGFSATSPSDPNIGAMRAIIASFAFIPRAPTPVATARPPRSAEAVADALAASFAAKNVAALSALMGDCMISGAEQAGFGSHTPERFAIILRDQFAAGSSVVVRPRPIESAPGYAAGAGETFSIPTTWTDPGQAPMRVDLIIAADGAFHYWRGMVRRQQPPP